MHSRSVFSKVIELTGERWLVRGERRIDQVEQTQYPSPSGGVFLPFPPVLRANASITPHRSKSPVDQSDNSQLLPCPFRADASASSIPPRLFPPCRSRSRSGGSPAFLP